MSIVSKIRYKSYDKVIKLVRGSTNVVTIISTTEKAAINNFVRMVSFVEIKGFDEFAKYTDNVDPKGPPVLFYFSGSKRSDGTSWCPDCVEAEPIVKAFLNELQRDAIFVYVDVGDREYWKDKACPFRTDSRCKLMVIPTIIKWKGVQRLEGSQCNKIELLRMLFEDDD